MLAGSRVGHDVLNDGFAHVVALGLVTRWSGVWEVANPLYREVIVRELTFVQQTQLRYEPAWYLRDDGTLDKPKVLAAWQKFWRKDRHLAAEGFHYRKAGPRLMLMAFLQRVLNGGGSIEREYGLGRGAVDLVVSWHGERHAEARDLHLTVVGQQHVLRAQHARGPHPPGGSKNRVLVPGILEI